MALTRLNFYRLHSHTSVLIILVSLPMILCGDQEAKCLEFLETRPEAFSMYFFKENLHDDYGYFETTDGKYELQNYIKFHKISSIASDDWTTSLCTSFLDTTTHIKHNTRDTWKAGWVTFNTHFDVATSIVNVSTWCWKQRKTLSDCNPVFLPMPGLMDTALYKHSALSEEFWNHVQDEHMFERKWIWRMNYQTNEGNMDSTWVSRLNISSVQELQLIGNTWGRPESLIGPLPKLRKLDLTGNGLERLPNNTFDNVPELTYMILGHNNISQVPRGIGRHKRLQILDLTNPTGNATLEISNDDLESLGSLSSLRTLGLERTKLKTNVSALLALENVKFLNLSGCFFGNIEDYYETDPKINSQLLTLDLSFNNLTELPATIISRLIKLIDISIHDNFLSTCQNESIGNLTSLEKLNLSKNKISTLTVDCFNKLKNLKELDLSWNNLTSLEPLIFINSSNLKDLYLSHNRLSVIDGDVFLPLPGLKILDISFNQLLKVPYFAEVELSRLDLSHNSLTKITNTSSVKFIEDINLSWNTIRELSFDKINRMNLSFNSITNISGHTWKNLLILKSIDLGGNNFQCCHNDTALLKRNLNTHSNKIWSLHPGKLFTCILNEDQEVLLNKFRYNNTVCNESSLLGIDFALELGVPLVLLCFVVGISTTMLYFYRTELTYISHLFKMKKRGWQKDEERYNVCSYDAFVCYSGKNFKWVIEQLLPNLENGPGGYRLCMHDRDFTLGAAIDTNVIVSLEKSRKVIFVLSQDFIGSRWCQWELEMANHKMFEENRGYIILIELDRIDRKSMPRHLRYLMDTRTYLEWPQDSDDEQKIERCWKRLRHAMGDSILKRTGKTAPKCSVMDI